MYFIFEYKLFKFEVYDEKKSKLFLQGHPELFQKAGEL